MHVEVRFLDDGSTPHGVEQLVLADKTAGPLKEDDQEIERSPAECDMAPFDAKAASGDVDLDGTENECALHAV